MVGSFTGSRTHFSKICTTGLWSVTLSPFGSTHLTVILEVETFTFLLNYVFESPKHYPADKLQTF